MTNMINIITLNDLGTDRVISIDPLLKDCNAKFTMIPSALEIHKLLCRKIAIENNHF